MKDECCNDEKYASASTLGFDEAACARERNKLLSQQLTEPIWPKMKDVKADEFRLKIRNRSR